MKISFLVPHFKLSGGMVITLTYAVLLAEMGHEITVYAPSSNKIRRYFANLLNLKKPFWIKSSSVKFKRIDKFSNKNIPSGDVAIAFNLYTADCLNALSDKVGKKLFSTQHDEGLFHFDQEYAHKVYSQPVKKIVVSTWLKEVMRNKYDVDSDVVLNTIDKKVFFRQVVNKSIKKLRILLLHHTFEWKGSIQGVEIVKELQKKYPNLELVMFGTRMKKINIHDVEYHYRPFGKNLAKIYSNCDIFLCPSWYEGFGLPSLEAMACGCAVVTYDNGGSRDFAFDGKTALVAKRKDKEDLKNKLEVLIKDKDLRKNISENGIKFVKAMPSWEDQARKLEKILSSC